MDKGKFLKEYGLITVGIFIISAAVYFFMIPSNVIVGSLSGLVIVLEFYSNSDFSHDIYFECGTVGRWIFGDWKRIWSKDDLYVYYAAGIFIYI